MSEVVNTSEETKVPQPEVTPAPAPVPTPPASTEIKQETQDDLVDKLSKEATAAVEKADAEVKARLKAEDKIVELKRKLKDLGADDEDEPRETQPITEEVLRPVVEKVLAERGAIDTRKDDELQKAKDSITELTAALKGKPGQATAPGTNQDRYEPEPELEKTLSALDRQVLERRAAAKGMTLREYLKKNP